MKNKVMCPLTLLGWLALHSLLWASQSERPSTAPSAGGALALILFVICYSRRKKAIGGWLLFYFIQLFWGVFLSLILTLTSIRNYNPSEYGSTSLYLLFLMTTIPSFLLRLAQVGLSFKLIPDQHRNWKFVNMLRVILGLELLFALIGIPIDLVHWPENVALDIFALIWPLIWLPYFSFSKRVRSVYLSKDWDALHAPKVA